MAKAHRKRRPGQPAKGAFKSPAPGIPRKTAGDLEGAVHALGLDGKIEALEDPGTLEFTVPGHRGVDDLDDVDPDRRVRSHPAGGE